MTTLPPNASVSSSTDLRRFLSNAPFVAFLDACWREKEDGYLDPSTGIAASTGIQHHLLIYHVYMALLGEGQKHSERASALARRLSVAVREDGLLSEPDGAVNDHPASGCHVADALGTFCHYAGKLGLPEAETEAPRAALVRMVENHFRIRLPEGTEGWTQQMRFELRAYYWAWRVAGEEKYRKACFDMWKNGIHAYRHPICRSGHYAQPSLRPDYTWNYAGGGPEAEGRADCATNTHTPVYYCTEPQGFAFVYHHGLKEGVFTENAEWTEFSRHYFLGLLRNLSRAGHTASDLDGYGVHRAWFSGCLIESVPVEAAGVSVGLDPEVRGWFRWYVDRYVDFVRRQPTFAETGLPEQLPYGQNITIEKQFSALLGSRFYSYLARCLFEYDIEGIAPVEPPAYYSYAWWHDWVRVSTPRYETSFAGKSSLCSLPVVKFYGDPNLGCLLGGSPLATLFVGNELLYATSNDPAGLWHVEVGDVNGKVFRSCATSFRDATTMAVHNAEGEVLTRDSFTEHEAPHIGLLPESASARPAEVLWSKAYDAERIRFFVRNGYGAEGFASEWGVGFPAGNYAREIAFILPVPIGLKPEIEIAGAWRPFTASSSGDRWPEAVRWSKSGKTVTVSLRAKAPAKDAPAVPTFEGGFRAVPVPTGERSPGGENSFCPYPLLQLRLEVKISAPLNRAVLETAFAFSA